MTRGSADEEFDDGRPDAAELAQMDEERAEYMEMLRRDGWVERYSESLGWYE